MYRGARSYDSFESCWDEELYLPVTSGAPLSTGRGCLNKTEHSYFEVQQGRSPGLLALVSRYKDICCLAYAVLHIHANCSIAKKTKLDELQHIENAAFPVYSIFVGHGYLQHGTCGWLDFYSLRYLTHLIPS